MGRHSRGAPAPRSRPRSPTRRAAERPDADAAAQDRRRSGRTRRGARHRRRRAGGTVAAARGPPSGCVCLRMAYRGRRHGRPPGVGSARLDPGRRGAPRDQPGSGGIGARPARRPCRRRDSRGGAVGARRHGRRRLRGRIGPRLLAGDRPHIGLGRVPSDPLGPRRGMVGRRPNLVVGGDWGMLALEHRDQAPSAS